MTRIVLLAVLVLGMGFFTSCKNCEPEEQVPITWSAGKVNPYDGQDHKLVVMFFYVSNPTQFMNIPAEQLTAPGYSSLAAMPADRITVAPDTSGVHSLGPRGQETYSHVGVLALYYQNAQRKVVKIPSDCSLQLRLEPRSIGDFGTK